MSSVNWILAFLDALAIFKEFADVVLNELLAIKIAAKFENIEIRK